MHKLLCAAATLLLGLLAAGPALAQTGTALLQKAEALDRAGQFDAAQTAYAQARAAFSKAGDLNGQQKALTELAAMDERMADQLLKGAGAAPPPAAAAAPVAKAARPVAPAPAPVRVAAAAPARVVAPAGAAPLPGSTASGRPVGLFFFVSSSDFNNQHTYYFTPAGQVYLDPADYSAAALVAVGASRRGTYAVNGSQMTIKWADGRTTSGNYQADPTGFGCQGSFMCLAPFASARQLVGTFEGRNAAATVNASSLVVFKTLNLQPDGTFTRDLYAASHSEARHADGTALATDVASARGQPAGHWNLAGWYLTLTDAQGTVRAVAFPTDWDDKTGQTRKFQFNGTSYLHTGQ